MKKVFLITVLCLVVLFYPFHTPFMEGVDMVAVVMEEEDTGGEDLVEDTGRDMAVDIVEAM